MALTTGLVSYYKFDDTSGDAIDSVSGYNGALTAGVTQGSTGKLGTAYTYNGSGFVNVNGTTASDLVLSINMSIAMWLNLSSMSGYYLLQKGAVSASGYTIALDAPKYITFYTCQSGANQTTVSNSDALTGALKFLVITCNSSGAATIYINGTEAAGYLTKGTHTAPLGTTSNLTIGGRVAQDYGVTGVVDEVGLWNRTLSAAEVTSLYNSGTGLSYPFGETAATNMKINIADTFKDVATMNINIADVWKPVTHAYINIADAWKTIF